MAWTTPSTRAVGDMITAAIYNDEIVNNLKALRQPRLTMLPLYSTSGENPQSTAYVIMAGSRATFYSSVFPATGTLKLHFSYGADPAGGTIFAELYDLTGTAVIAGSPTSGATAGAGNGEAMSSNLLAGFTTGARQYAIYAKETPSTAASKLYRAWLQVEW